MVDKEAHIRRKGLLAAITGMVVMAGLGWVSNPIGVTVQADEISLPVNLCTVIGREVLTKMVPNPGIPTPAGHGPAGPGSASEAACRVSTKPGIDRDLPRAQLSVEVSRYYGKEPRDLAHAAYQYARRTDSGKPGYRILTGLGDEAHLANRAMPIDRPVVSTVTSRSGADTVVLEYHAEPASQKLADRTAMSLVLLILSRVSVRA